VKEGTRGILNLGNSLLTTTLPKKHASGRSMSKNMSTDRLAAISTSKERAGTGVTLDLVCLSKQCKI
jgi:hypothetical protein